VSFPPYDSYKSTGHDWLGEIPTSWRTQKFRHLFRESSEKIEGEVFGEMLSVSGYRGIERKEYDDENRRRSDEDLIGYRIVRKGQLVVNTMWLNYAGLGFSELDGHVSPAYRAYWPKSDEHSKYLNYLLRSEHYVKGYTRLLTGVRPNSLQMSRDNVMSFPVVLPPKAEQIAISTFLDGETAKIDALIAEQQRLIELLQEKRQAVISQVVTKGLSPNAPMKDSGVEWLGEVPEHWEVGHLRRFTKTVKTGKTPDDNDFMEQESAIPWFTPGSFNESTLALEAAKYVSIESVNEGRANLFSSNAVLVVGIGATLGKIGVPSEECSGNQQINAIEPSGRLQQRFLALFLAAAQEQMRISSNASTLGIMNQQKTKELVVACPPLVEQRQIIDHADKVLADMADMSGQSQRVIELLQERRSALISAAVTGQIDVRGLAEAEEEVA